MLRKALITIIFITILFSNIYADGNLTKIIKAYNNNLESDSKGVVESSLMYISKLRLDYPKEDYHNVVSKLDRLMKNEKSKSLHYKIYLTRLLPSSPHLQIENPDTIDFVEPSDFFLEISEQLFKGIDVTTK